MLLLLLQAIWLILPAWIANASAPLARGRRRMDFGKKLGGNDLFGKGKTWEGFIIGGIAGFSCGLIQCGLQPLASDAIWLPQLTIPAIFLLAWGAMLGDLLASFGKRRASLSRGYKVPVLDQLDFALSALILASLAIQIPLLLAGLALILTAPLSYGCSILGHRLKIKEVPW